MATRFAKIMNGEGFARSIPSPAFLEGQTMKTKALQLFFLILATLFVAAIVRFVSDSITVTALSGTYTAVLGLFLGVDLATMIHKTQALSRGAYKEINMHRYVTALCVFSALIIETFIISSVFKRELNSLYLCFGVGFLIVAGGLISGIEANKIATDEGPKNNAEA
jgi:hypothetical protein